MEVGRALRSNPQASPDRDPGAPPARESAALRRPRDEEAQEGRAKAQRRRERTSEGREGQESIGPPACLTVVER
jgi:hypothetical protein